MKYKVGDKVRVIADGTEDKLYYMEDRSVNNSMVYEMLVFCGKVVTITDITGCMNPQYIVGESGGWGWVDEMFEGLAEQTPTIIFDELETAPTPTHEQDYTNACWYCRKGGLVDRILNGQLGICPNCGRVCNNGN